MQPRGSEINKKNGGGSDRIFFILDHQAFYLRNPRTRGPEDQRTRGPEDQRTTGPEDQRIRGLR